jgi:hypothetical protein
MSHAWERCEMRTEFSSKDLKGNDYFAHLVDINIKIKIKLNEKGLEGVD